MPIYEQVNEITVLIVYAISEGSDEPAQMRSLVRAFAARTQRVGPQIKARANFHVSSPTR